MQLATMLIQKKNRSFFNIKKRETGCLQNVILAPFSSPKIPLSLFCCLIPFSSYFLTNIKTHSVAIQKFFRQSALPFYPSFSHTTLTHHFSHCPPETLEARRPFSNTTHLVILLIAKAFHLYNTMGKGGRPARGRVPERTGRRSRCCGFAEVLGFSRAGLEGMNIGFGDFKMTAWSFRTSLTKWDPLTRPGS